MTKFSFFLILNVYSLNLVHAHTFAIGKNYGFRAYFGNHFHRRLAELPKIAPFFGAATAISPLVAWTLAFAAPSQGALEGT